MERSRFLQDFRLELNSFANDDRRPTTLGPCTDYRELRCTQKAKKSKRSPGHHNDPRRLNLADHVLTVETIVALRFVQAPIRELPRAGSGHQNVSEGTANRKLCDCEW
jgi:hypothetical protein